MEQFTKVGKKHILNQAQPQNKIYIFNNWSSKQEKSGTF